MNETVASTPTGDPWLLTPGPLTTSPSVKEAMLHDFGSRDTYFIAVNGRIRERLVEIVNGIETHVCIPLQGSGTFVVEAMLGTFVPPDGQLLVLINGAYGERMLKMAKVLGRAVVAQRTPEDVPVDVDALDQKLSDDPSISHVAVVHCETTTGLLNPLEAVAECVERHGRSLLVDSMSAFGALPIDATQIRFDALVASSNKCLEGTAGVGFCLARSDALEQTKGNAHSLALDLYDQYTSMEGNGQWRFTPPVQTILSLAQALDEFQAEGGVAGRGQRYRENCRVLIEGMRQLGFRPLLPDHLQAPIIVTFHVPADPRFDFEAFYEGMRRRGYVIYPGKLTVAESFRMGCIGRLEREQIRGALGVVETVLRELGVASCEPAAA